VVDKIKKWCIIVVDDKEIARRRSKAPGLGRVKMKYNLSEGFEVSSKINGKNHILKIFDDGIRDTVFDADFIDGRAVSWAPYTGGLFGCDTDGRLTGDQYQGTCLEVWEKLARSIGNRYLYKKIIAAAQVEKARQGRAAMAKYQKEVKAATIGIN